MSSASLSYCRGPAETLLQQTIPQKFAETVARFPDREALVARHQGLRYTWRQLAAAVERTARGLCSLGIEPGDHIGVWLSNCTEWVLLQLGAARVGAVLVNVNPAYRSHELHFVLSQSKMKAIFLRSRDARADYRAILEESRDGSHVPLKYAICVDEDAWTRMLENGMEPPPVPEDPHAVANIQYTSGTTGSPKGVLLSHHNVLNNAYLISRNLRTTEQDRLCMPVPMYHCFGCVMSSLQCVVTGATLVMPAAQFDAAATLQAIHEERATVIHGVPTMFIAQLDHPGFSKYDLSSLRTGIMAGSSCPIEVMKKVTGQMHCRELTIAYGQTESSPVITQSRVEDSLELRVSTVGRAMPETEVKIISTESGETLPVGDPGELCTRGYLVMKGYDGNPEAAAKVVGPDGWLRTGDLAVMRPDGHFRITGRAKDMIIRGGENIYPQEIEDYLHLHPKVSDVHVVGLPDARLGETVLAWVKLRPGETASEAEIQDFCRGKIAYFKVPQHVRFVDSFPMTVTGKVQKFRMREIEIEERGLQKEAKIETA